jgi:hypothetical protein
MLYKDHLLLCAVIVPNISLLILVTNQFTDYSDRVHELNKKNAVIKTALESKVLSKENSFWSQGYKVVVKTPNMPVKSIFVTVDDYARLKPSDTVCIQYSQLDGKNQDFQLCPKK